MRIIDHDKIIYFQKALLSWYLKNNRLFPWREKTATSYQLILSEVFLQRTKAESVAVFLPCFLNKYPGWEKLGEASERQIQELIKPIGLYKQKGTRLFKLAQEIKIREGKFPMDRKQIEKLPMMGQYITNAYELFVLKKRVPLLDVNMARLLERFFGERDLADIRNDPYLQTLSYRVVDHPKAKELNWAILDYSSLICNRRPSCEKCQINSNCISFNI